MRILITGADGMLGTDLREALGTEHDLVPTDLIGGLRFLDVTDTDQVLSTIAEVKPDAVIHAAAYTDVDGCERDPDKAFRVNGLGTWNVATACARIGATLVYISTDFVFDGEKGEPYTEYDAVNPLGHYGASKLAGETHVRTVCRKHFIVRTAWLYGVHGKSFPRAMIDLARTREEISVVADQVGSPTFTVDLARAIGLLLDNPLCGTYHVTNKGSCSWYEFAARTLALAGINNIKVKPIKAAEWPSPTRRPKYSVLRHCALEFQGRDNMRPWEDALADFVSRLDL